MSRGVLHVPSLGIVGDQDAGAAAAARFIVDAQQQLHRFLGACGLTEQNGGDFGLLDTQILVGIHLVQRVGAADGLGGAHGHAHLIGAARLVGGVGVGAAAVRALAADRVAVVIAEGGVGVAVLGEGVGEAVAAVVHLARDVLSGRADVEQLVVAVGDVLRAGQDRLAPGGQAGADIDRRAGQRAHGRETQDQCKHKGNTDFHFGRHDAHRPC